MVFAEQAANVPQMNFAPLKKYMRPSLIDTDQDSGEDNDDENNINATADVIVQDTELDPVESIVMVFEQLDLNMNSRYNIREGSRGVWESIRYVTCNFASHN